MKRHARHWPLEVSEQVLDCPTLTFPHCDALVDPRADVEPPTGQFWQCGWPCWLWNVPAQLCSGDSSVSSARSLYRRTAAEGAGHAPRTARGLALVRLELARGAQRALLARAGHRRVAPRRARLGRVAADAVAERAGRARQACRRTRVGLVRALRARRRARRATPVDRAVRERARRGGDARRLPLALRGQCTSATQCGQRGGSDVLFWYVPGGQGKHDVWPLDE